MSKLSTTAQPLFTYPWRQFMKLFNALLAVAVCTGLVFAQAATTTPAASAAPAAPAKATKSTTMKVTGTVVSVDAISNILVIKKSAKKEDTLTITTDTKVMSAGKAITLGDLKADDKVNVSCKKEEGKMVAIAIKLIPPAAEKKPVEPKK